MFNDQSFPEAAGATQAANGLAAEERAARTARSTPLPNNPAPGILRHAPALQFARPDWGIAFDVDVDAAATTRLRTMDMAVADRMLIADMRLDFPALVTSGAVSTGRPTAFCR